MKDTASHWTPINDQYPSCAEVRVELLVYTGLLSPHEVTLRLGLQPSQVNELGQKVVTRSGRTRFAKSNYWLLSSEGHVQSLDLRRHIDWLVTLLAPNTRALSELQEVEGLVISVNCVWYSRAGHGGPTLWPEQMRALADLNLECTFDVYFFDDEP